MFCLGDMVFLLAVIIFWKYEQLNIGNA